MNEYIKHVNRIEFVVTMACTGSCRHCSEGDHGACTGHIDADVAANSIREICRNYKIKSLMTFGGEPLFYPEVVCQIFRGMCCGIRHFYQIESCMARQRSG